MTRSADAMLTDAKTDRAHTRRNRRSVRKTGPVHDQRSDLGRDRQSSGATTCAPVVVVRDQPTMPGQQGTG
jgi:hypothetical protein